MNILNIPVGTRRTRELTAVVGRCGCCSGRHICGCGERGRCLVCARCPEHCRCPNVGRQMGGGVVVCVAPYVPTRAWRGRPAAQTTAPGAGKSVAGRTA